MPIVFIKLLTISLCVVLFGCKNLSTTQSNKPLQNGAELNDFPGSKLYLATDDTAPAVIMIHGSEGGTEAESYTSYAAKPFLQAGFHVVTYCYFGCPGRPDVLYRIELNEVLRLVQWLKNHSSINKRFFLYGGSRGAEQTLLLVSLVQTNVAFSAVAVLAPSDTVVSSYDPKKRESVVETTIDERGDKRYLSGAAWLWNGKEISGDQLKIQNVPPEELFRGLSEENAYRKWLELTVPGPRIELEKFRGPVYIAHGSEDEVWEVERSHRIVAARSKTPQFETVFHEFEGEDHSLSVKDHFASYYQMIDEVVAFFMKHNQ